MEPLKQNKINILDNDEKINEIIINLDNYEGNSLYEHESSFYKFMNQRDSDDNNKKMKNSTKAKKASNDKSGNSFEKYTKK